MNHREHGDADAECPVRDQPHNDCDAVSNVTLHELCVLDGSNSIRRRGLML